MSFAAAPAPMPTSPLRRVWFDIQSERHMSIPFPPGDTRFSMRRTERFAHYPLPILLDAYERYGPVFTLRILHGNSVWMLGPDANHYVTVSHASNFRWRDGFMADLIPLLGDGLLTIDGEFHRRSRKIMLPAFHRERIEGANSIMEAEAARALDRVRPGEVFDLYRWTRELALRIAMRALFGLDPDAARAGDLDAAGEFESALSFWSRDYVLQMLRGPRTPWRHMTESRERRALLICGSEQQATVQANSVPQVRQ